VPSVISRTYSEQNMTTDLTRFADLPADARVWVYQSQRPLTAEECSGVRSAGDDFIGGWAAHGKKLNARFDVLYDRFIVLVVDERSAAASGCGIDESVRFIRSLAGQLGTDLLERLNLAYLRPDGSVGAVHANALAATVANGELNADTTVFNNMVTTKAELETKWRIALRHSWAASRLASQGAGV
jgi:hypothetical protein